MTITLQPVKGTRDFYPEEMRLRNWLFQIWRESARQFGFEEYDACVLEHEDLYVRKAGDEITGQLYSFGDKSGRALALRPEMTPSLARLILQRKNTLTFPLKWFSIPQCFRYERMTRGRKREHFQWNADVVGQPDSVAEVEVLSVLLTSLEQMGLGPSQVRVRLNDRRLIGAVLSHLEIPAADHVPVMVVMDKRDKISPEALATMLVEQGLLPKQIEGINRFLSMGSLDEVAAELGGEESVAALSSLILQLEQAGFGDYSEFDITVVRGLSYYTGTVFELRDAAGGMRAICGGGRYDSLLSTFGGEAVPAIGFGFGDVVIMDLLADYGLLPKLGRNIDIAVIPFSVEQFSEALEVAQALRRAGYRVDTDFSARKLKRALQRASELGVGQALLLMPNELEQNNLVLRDMATRTERTVSRAEVLSGSWATDGA